MNRTLVRSSRCRFGEAAGLRIGAMLEAFRYGAPPHGGIAPRVDRLIMLLKDEPNIREVMAPPRFNPPATRWWMPPSPVTPEQLKELHIKTIPPPARKPERYQGRGSPSPENRGGSLLRRIQRGALAASSAILLPAALVGPGKLPSWIEVHANDETMIQLYLDAKRNRILLEPSMMHTLRREVWIANNKADFVVELPPGERYVLIELERPIHKLFTKDDRFKKEVVHTQQQVEDWMDRISEHPHEAQETLPGIREPEGWVVIGRRSSMTENQQRVLERKNARLQNITIMTYDDLLDRARQRLENLRSLKPDPELAGT